jgi:hypothetical protein
LLLKGRGKSAGRAVSGSLSNNRATYHRFLLETKLYKMGRSQISTTSIFQSPYGKLIGLAAGISHPWAFVGVSLSAAKGANSPMVEFLDVVACLQPGCAEI